jgi:hypothetical protein
MKQPEAEVVELRMCVSYFWPKAIFTLRHSTE